MITVRPVIIDASICYGIPCNMGAKRKSRWEILHMDAEHAQGWRFRIYGRRNMSDESAAKLADPSIDNIEAFLSCDILFSARVHPPHGHFAWDKEDIPKRLYIHPDTKETFYMQGQYGQFIQETRIRPKRVTRKKIPFYIDPRDGSILHSAPFRLIDRANEIKEHKSAIKNGWAQVGSSPKKIKADLVIGKKEYVKDSYGFHYMEGCPEQYAFDLDFNEVPIRIVKETVNALYSLNWKADAITNFSTIIDMLAEDGA
jgi:hypothetical protein